jgi:glutamate synthase (NADPH/NADH) small chain
MGVFMSDIKYKSKGSILNPLKSWQFFARKPVTEPMEPRLASKNYRGFHVNDWEQCIGCSTCQKVCDNAAITMIKIPSLVEDPVNGVRNLRPAIDYGRCCWCGLCVDICPTGSISLSREYVHICDQDTIDSYFMLPDPDGMHNKYFGLGWSKTQDADLVDLNRQTMGELEPEQRIGNFEEIVDGFDKQHAIIEASRCVQCGMCHDSCPTHMHAPEYIRSIWEGDLEEAVRWIYKTNPFAHVCGRVCTHRCESACSIGRRGEPVAIRWLKRYAMDSVDHSRVKEIAAEGVSGFDTGKRVAIVGSGPAGLTAAYDLAKQGHSVVVFEAQDKPGGMMRYGIPEYRLPYNRLDDDINTILSLGVELRLNMEVGKDITFDQLHSDYDAVLTASGLHEGRSTRIPGSEHSNTVSAITLLRQITKGNDFDVPKKAVIIGGGNVAMDIARSLARYQIDVHGEVDIVVTALESRETMLADESEIREAEEEGVCIIPSRGPRQCVIEEDNLTGLETVFCSSIFDEEGRFHPKFDESDVVVHDADIVVEAIGQTADVSYLGDDIIESLEWQRGRLQVDENGQTAEQWLWAAGDMVEGPDVVHAIAAGHRVAASIHDNLMGNIRKSA